MFQKITEPLRHNHVCWLSYALSFSGNTEENFLCPQCFLKNISLVIHIPCLPVEIREIATELSQALPEQVTSVPSLQHCHGVNKVTASSKYPRGRIVLVPGTHLQEAASAPVCLQEAEESRVMITVSAPVASPT